MDNHYAEHVFLERLLERPGFADAAEWRERQRIQLDYVRGLGFGPASRLLDIGCGPLRLGSALIGELDEGFYFGADVNPRTLALGERVLSQLGVTGRRYALSASSNFDFAFVDAPVDFAFSNSLMSHLAANSILLCLTHVKPVLAAGGAYHSTAFMLGADQAWSEPATWRRSPGRTVTTYPHRDPYHYTSDQIDWLADQAGFAVEPIFGYAHPTQTMLRFQPL